VRKNHMREKTPEFEKYWQQLFPDPSPVFALAKQHADVIGRGAISVSASEGKLIAFWVQSFRCKKFVEIGTLTGYSALWILWAMQSGQLWTFEKDESTAKTAANILSKASWGQAQVVTGDAEQTLKSIENQGPFDGIFIDGNKQAYPAYLTWAEANVKKGGLILADNVWLRGGVYGAGDDTFSDNQIVAMKNFNQRLSDPKKFRSTIIPTGEGLYVAEKL
jgi:predicted O-methyltransferase YrrM